jgi:hypothetical protein
LASYFSRALGESQQYYLVSSGVGHACGLRTIRFALVNKIHVHKERWRAWASGRVESHSDILDRQYAELQNSNAQSENRGLHTKSKQFRNDPNTESCFDPNAIGVNL